MSDQFLNDNPQLVQQLQMKASSGLRAWTLSTVVASIKSSIWNLLVASLADAMIFRAVLRIARSLGESEYGEYLRHAVEEG